MKDERGRRRALDAFGKVVDEAAIAVDADHRVVDEFVEARGNRVAREARIERGRRGRDIDVEEIRACQGFGLRACGEGDRTNDRDGKYGRARASGIAPASRLGMPAPPWAH